MDYKYNIDSIDFLASKEDIEGIKKRIKFVCDAKKNGLNLILIIVDSKEIEKEIIELYKKLSQNYIIYDIYDKLKVNFMSANNITEYYSVWEEFNNIIKNQSTCITNCNKLRTFLDINTKKDGMYLLYNRIFNCYRDGIFRNHTSSVSLIIPYEDYIGILINAPDYAEYCTHINFNNCFKTTVQNSNYTTLDNYLYWKSHKNISDDSIKENNKILTKN